MNVDIIFAAASAVGWGQPSGRQRQSPSCSPPMVIPLATGHVKSLAQPGGNITGLSMLLTDLAVKELEILKESMPQATRIGVLCNSTTLSNHQR